MSVALRTRSNQHLGERGRILEGRTYDEMPPRANNPVPDRKERLAMQAMIAKGAATV